MWIFLNNGYFSIVKPTAADPIVRKLTAYASEQELTEGYLLVRARRKGDIDTVFGKALKMDEISHEVMIAPDRDYRFRALVRRHVVADLIAAAVLDVRYGNFKNSIKDRDYHDACARVWGVMDDYQRRHAKPPRERNALSLAMGYDYSTQGESIDDRIARRDPKRRG